MIKKTQKHVGLLNRAKIMESIVLGKDIEELLKTFSAPQLQELRTFLLDEVVYLSREMDESPKTISEVKALFEPIPNYYYRQDCREPLEACYNETCFASNPGCFSRKMFAQIAVLLKLLRSYLQGQEDTNDRTH